MRKSSEYFEGESKRLEKHNVSHVQLSNNLEGEKNNNKRSILTRRSHEVSHKKKNIFFIIRSWMLTVGGQFVN